MDITFLILIKIFTFVAIKEWLNIMTPIYYRFLYV